MKHKIKKWIGFILFGGVSALEREGMRCLRWDGSVLALIWILFCVAVVYSVPNSVNPEGVVINGLTQFVTSWNRSVWITAQYSSFPNVSLVASSIMWLCFPFCLLMFVKYRNELFLCNEVRRKNLEKKVVSLQWLLFLGVILMVYLGVWLLGDPGPDGVFKGRGVNDVVGRLMTRTKLGLAMHVGFCQALLCTFIAGIFAHQKIRNEMKSRSENDE